MNTTAYFSKVQTLERLYMGPLGTHIELYAARLLKEGHCRQSGARCLRVVGDFSRWLARKRLGLADVNESTVEQYQRFRARHRCPFSSDRPALHRLLSVLRNANVIAPKPPASLCVHEQILEDFGTFLRQDRGLSDLTIIRHVPVVRQFLQEHCSGNADRFSRLTSADITGFIQRHAHDHSTDSAKNMCWTLRAFLRYLQLKSEIVLDLASSVPTVRRWRFASLPSHLSADQVQRVLGSCDRRTLLGRRDYAVLMLLARLGLRAKEVVALTLDDIDWDSGQVLVSGKGRRREHLPLSPETGAAIAAYLESARPQSDCRQVFLRMTAPHRGFASSSGVTGIANAALRRSGIDGLAHMGAHVFRHTLATELLHAGATLTEIGQVLRHQSHDTTRIYAKVDISTLRSLGQPWPGGV